MATEEVGAARQLFRTSRFPSVFWPVIGGLDALVVLRQRVRLSRRRQRVVAVASFRAHGEAAQESLRCGGLEGPGS